MDYITINELEKATDYGLLAVAVYKDAVVDSQSNDSLESRLNAKDGDSLSYFSPELSSSITDKYEYIASMDDEISDFQAVFLREKNTNHYVMAIRGTASAHDAVVSDVRIGTDGIAYGQVVSAKVFFDRVVANLPEDVEIDVTGHSLGGHITTLLMGMEHDQISEVYTWNGAGVFEGPLDLIMTQGQFDIEEHWGTEVYGVQSSEYMNAASILESTYQDILLALNSDSVSQRITNFVVGGDVVSEIGTNYAERETFVYTESENTNFLQAHFSAPIADALLLQRLLLEIDPSIDYGEVVSLIKQSDNYLAPNTFQPSRSLESTLRILANTFGIDYDVPSVDSSSNDEYRYAFQSVLFQVQSELARYSNLEIVSVDSLRASAKNNDATGFAYRFALLELNTFVITGDLSIYDSLNSKGELNAENFSDKYIEDRALLLESLIERNIADSTNPSEVNGEAIRFYGTEIGEVFAGGNTSGQGNTNTIDANEVTNVVFGSNGHDNTPDLYGRDQNDRVYGLNGEDTIHGGKGRDHLEGNADNDTLHGGEGGDFLYGGSGDDHLYGDTGNDILDGGADNDTYHFSDGHGHDTIEDVEGINKIMFGDMAVTELKKVEGTEDTYKNVNEADDRIYKRTYFGFQIIAANGSDIIDVVAQSDFSRFGITVNDNQPEPIPETGDILIGDGHDVDGHIPIWKPDYAGHYNVEQNLYYDASIYDPELYSMTNLVRMWEFWGGKGDDTLIGGIYNDMLQGNLGDDTLVGQGGFDSLYGHNGNDTLLGGAGEDLLVGGSGSDTLVGGYSDDQLFGNGPYIDLEVETGAVTSTTGTDEGDFDTAEGGYGNDTISSGDYADVLSGNQGEDRIFGGAGNDVIDGGEDNDFIMGDSSTNLARYTRREALEYEEHVFTVLDHVDSVQSELSYNDTMEGGAGNDTLIGEVGNDTISGGTGDDLIIGDKLNDSSLYGGDQGEHISFTDDKGIERDIAVDDFVEFQVEWSGDDTLSGGDGADTIMGNAGNDHLSGDAGEDVLYGDDLSLDAQHHGNDTLLGGEGADELHGNGGDDELHGGTENDELFGGQGNDHLYGDEGNDQLEGGEGNDTLSGGAGNDIVNGGEGDDQLSGGTGSDVLAGDAGDDTYIVRPGDGVITIEDTSGNNSISFEGGLTLGDLNAYTTQHPPTSNQFIRIKYGSAEGDVVTMSHATFTHLSGISLSDGTSSNLTLQHPEGSELGSSGDDTIDGNGDSSYFAGLEGNDTIDAGAGNDVVYGDQGNDTLSGNSGSDHLFGGAGDDVIGGGLGNDFIYGGSGNDTYLYNLGDGADVIATYDQTEGRRDILLFGDNISKESTYLTRNGDDMVIVLNRNDQVKIENFFKDNNAAYALTAIRFNDGTEWDLNEMLSRTQLTTPFDDYDVHGTDGDDVIDGLAGDDTIYGHEGNDQLSGSEDTDFLWGGTGNDTLSGGDDFDQLYGEQGDDTLIGGHGDDDLVGGEGNNIYRYALGDGNDRIFGSINNTADTIVFDASIRPEDVSLSLLRGGNQVAEDALNILIESSGEEIIVTNFFHDNQSLQTSMSFVFEYDGTTWTESEIREAAFQETEGADLIHGTGASDTINGLGGNDTLHGHDGDDVLSGGSGSDDLYGGTGEDNLDGGQDDDNLWGSDGNDTLIGGDGRDDLYGENGDDVLLGGTGDDRRLFGGFGNDTIDGGEGNDLLSGGLGDDVYIFGEGRGHDVIANYFQVGFDGNYQVPDTEYQLDTDKIKLVGGLTASDIELSRASNNDPDAYKTHDDLLITLTATGETLRVENFFSLTDIDTESSNNIDLIEFDDGTTLSPVEIYSLLDSTSSEEADYRVLGDGTTSTNTNLMSGNDVLYGSLGDDTVVGEDGEDKVFGRGGNDIIYGGDHDDDLYGQDGDDQLLGGSGNDWLEGGNGNDYFEGGAGNDRLHAIAGNNTIIYNKGDGHDSLALSESGLNTLQLGAGFSLSDIEIRHTGTNSIHINFGDLRQDSIIVGAQGLDRIVGEGFDLTNLSASGAFIDLESSTSYLPGIDEDDEDRTGHFTTRLLRNSETWEIIDSWHEVRGTSKDDIIFGTNDSSDVDKIYGGDGNDYLAGQRGDDELYGGDGQDELNGGNGDNLLSGGAGDDSYIVSASTGTDTISDIGSDFNVIEVDSALSPDETNLMRNADNLEISFATGKKVIVSGYFSQENATGVIDEIRFEDGTIWDQDYIAAQLQQDESIGPPGDNYLTGSNQGDTLYGGEGNDNLDGLGGDDALHGESGNDLIIGGAGNDLLIGGAGYNQYGFLPGFGQDTIIEAGDGASEIGFQGGISDADISYARQGNDLIVSHDGTSDFITVKDWYQSSSHQVAVVFVDFGVYHSVDYIASAVTNSVLANNDPLASSDIASVQEDSSVIINVLANDSDIDGDSLIVTSATSANGTVIINSDGTLNYTPNANFNGLDEISYEVSDAKGGTATSLVRVTVNPENDVPIVVADTMTTQEDSSIIINVLANDSDIDDDSLVVTSAGSANGTVVINGDGTLNYTPNSNFNGLDEISYEVSDGNGGIATSSVMVTVNPENDVPIAVADTVSTKEDSSIIIDVLANDNDIDGDSLVVTSAASANGTVVINGDGTLNYTPNANFNGLDEISYEVSDGNGGIATSSVMVTVNPENDVPVAVADVAMTDKDVSILIDVLSNDSDIDGDSLAITSAAALNGSVTINNNGTLLYTPFVSFVGEDSISYTVSDGKGGVASESVSISVNPTMDDPLDLVGTNSREILEGGNNDDRLSALGGDDILYGYEGNDILYGGSGSDSLHGNQGDDRLSGGSGSDIYYYQSGDGSDRINNYSWSSRGETDKLSFESVEDIGDIWFTKTGHHLDIHVLGTEDHVRVDYWYRTSMYQLDAIEAGGHSIDAVGVEQLVQAMSVFGAPTNDGAISLNADERTQMNTTIAAAWA